MLTIATGPPIRRAGIVDFRAQQDGDRRGEVSGGDQCQALRQVVLQRAGGAHWRPVTWRSGRSELPRAGLSRRGDLLREWMAAPCFMSEIVYHKGRSRVGVRSRTPWRILPAAHPLLLAPLLAQVTDLSLIDYIAVKAKHDRYTPHSAGRFQKKRFRKAQCPIVERLTNSLMMHGRNNGKKQMAIRIVQHAFEIVHLLTDQNPIQVLVQAIINGGPREDATRIGSAGVVRRQAVDVSPCAA